MRCTRCDKRLSRKTARMIDGKALCSPCVFPPMRLAEGGRMGFIDLGKPLDPRSFGARPDSDSDTQAKPGDKGTLGSASGE